MLPLNYAVLRYFTTVEHATVDGVMEALKAQYGNYRAFTRHAILTALFVAKANLILDESYYELDDKNELQLYFKVTEDGRKMIATYIKE